jgi:hypothetical protein
VDLLVEHPAQADGVEPEPAVLRADVRAQVELAGGVAVDVAVEAGHAELRLVALAVVGQVELLLGQGGEEEAQALELDRREDLLEEGAEVVQRQACPRETSPSSGRFWR